VEPTITYLEYALWVLHYSLLVSLGKITLDRLRLLFATIISVDFEFSKNLLGLIWLICQEKCVFFSGFSRVFVLNQMVKFQFFGLKSFVMGFFTERNSFLLFSSLDITTFLVYALCLLCIFGHFWQAQIRKLYGDTRFKFTTMWGCIIATNYMDFSFSFSVCCRGVISLILQKFSYHPVEGFARLRRHYIFD